MKLTDSIENICDKKYTEEGYLIINARVSRPGIQEYKQFEIQSSLPIEHKSNEIETTYRLLRPRSEVFAADSLESLKYKPVTNGHPKGFVDSGNVMSHQVGMSTGSVVADTDFVRAELIVQDAKIIHDIERGKEQVSLGYSTDIEWVPGVDAEYGVYDAVQRKIKINHIAIVTTGRAGPDVKLGDTMNEENTEVLDAAPVVEILAEVEVAAEPEPEAKVEDAVPVYDAVVELETKVKELEAKLADAEKLTSAEYLDTLVAVRVELVDKATRINKVANYAGKTAIEVMSLALAEVVDCSGKSEEWISGAFEVANAMVKDSPVVKYEPEVSLEKKAREGFLERNRNAWKPKTEKN